MITRTTAAVAGLAVAAGLLLGGCSLLPPLPFLPGSDGDGGSSSDGSDIEDNPFLDHDVPDTFPSDIPLPDLEIVFALDVGTGWSIIYRSDDIEADHDRIKALFEDDGWEVLSADANSETTFAVYENEEYQVQVSGSTASNDYDGPVINLLAVAKD